MYLWAIRNLRDWRRYTPLITINNPNQVNIANYKQNIISRTDIGLIFAHSNAERFAEI